MKRFHLLLAATALMLSAVAARAAEPVTVAGKWERDVKASKICLYAMQDGELTELASTVPSADGTFYFMLSLPREDFYYIGLSKVRMDRYAFYLKAGDRLAYTVNDTSYTLTGTSSPENRALQAWHDFVRPLEWKSVYFMRTNSTYVDFFPLLDEKLRALPALPQSATGNAAFDRKFALYKTFNLADIAIFFLQTPRSAHPEGEDFPDYYRNFDLAAFTATASAILDFPNGISLLSQIIFNKLRTTDQTTKNPISDIMAHVDWVANDTLRGDVVASFIASNKSSAGIESFEGKYGKYLITQAQKNVLAAAKNKLRSKEAVEQQADAIDFTFKDAAGKSVSLSDFKGKVVYVDVWATWCGPCKREMPFMKKLEEEYRSNPNMVFMGVSTDAEKDKAKWQAYVQREQLKGVQLFGGAQKGKIMEPYGIEAIPRFLLFGKSGKVVSANAPRPSSEEIRPLLEKELKK